MTTYDFNLDDTFGQLIRQYVSKKDTENLTWGVITSIINKITGFSYDESVYRKYARGQQTLKYENFTIGEIRENNNVVEETKIMKIDNNYKDKIELQQLRDERNDLRRLCREYARANNFTEQVVNAIREYHADYLQYDDNKKFTGILKSDNDMLISLTDLHVGMYDYDVLKERMNKYLDEIFEIKLTHGCENAYVVCSEIISGLIHNTLRISANDNITGQFLFATDIISQFIAELSYQFNTVYVANAPGNHSRMTAKKEDNLVEENFDNLLIPFLEAKLQNFKNIEYMSNDFDSTIAAFYIRNNLIIASHGDRDNVSTMAQKITMYYGEQPAICLVGHKHTNAMVTSYNTKVIQSGSMSDTDEYAKGKRLTNRPEQAIAIVNNEGLRCLYDIKF